MPQPDYNKAKRYHDGGMRYACIACILANRPSAGDASTTLTVPADCSADLGAIVASIIHEGGFVRVCNACADVVCRGNPEEIGQHGIDQMRASVWWSTVPPHEQMALIAMVYFFMHAFTRTHIDPKHPAFPSINFMNDLSSQYPTMPPIHGTTVGPLNEFVRDLGYGCYVSCAPFGIDAVYLHDFASKRKHKGYGAIALRFVLDAADRTAVNLYGMVEPHANWGGRKDALPAPKLLAWYRRFGFSTIDMEQGRPVVMRPAR